jgi:hypothetical protein
LAAAGWPVVVGVNRHFGGRGLGIQGVVPGAVHGVPAQRQGREALLADGDAGGIVAGIQGGFDL